DGHVTGVQTCALPISESRITSLPAPELTLIPSPPETTAVITSAPLPLLMITVPVGLKLPTLVPSITTCTCPPTIETLTSLEAARSEERRVGKEGRAEM